MLSLALFLEYEDDVNRAALFRRARLNIVERNQVLDAILVNAALVDVSYRWRPNLRDEADNHLIDLAVAANARYLVTSNVRDFRGGELRFDHIEVVDPARLIEELTR